MTLYVGNMNRNSQRKLFTSLDPLSLKIDNLLKTKPVSNLNEAYVKTVDEAKINEEVIELVNEAYGRCSSELETKEATYYILGPVTDFDRKFIKKILEAGKKIHVFIQGGIERTADKIWSTGLLGAVPANAGMDYSNFYDFFEMDHDDNMTVYVQFTNMAKTGPSNQNVLSKLWMGDHMQKFLNDLEQNDQGAMFAKLWEYYNQSAGAAAWQHDPIEVINSLFQLPDTEYKQIVDKNRYVTYNKIDEVDGKLYNEKPTRAVGDKRIFAKLLDHDLNNEDYMKAQELRFKQFIRLLRQSFGISEQTMPSPIIVPEDQLKPLFSNMKGILEPENKLKPLFSNITGGGISVLNKTDVEHNTLIDNIITDYKTKYLPLISIEILDPDNNFAAQLIKYIGGASTQIYIHSQFYPVNVRTFCEKIKQENKMINMMNLPQDVYDSLSPEMKTSLGTHSEGISKKQVIFDDAVFPKNYYADITKFSCNFPTKVKLMYSKTFNENKNKYVYCAEAEINFMKDLLLYDKVFLGQTLYGCKDTDFTFTARGLLHPVSMFNLNEFTNKDKNRSVFVQNVFSKVSGTAFELTERGLIENYRTENLKLWAKLPSNKSTNANQSKLGGGRTKKRRTKRRKTRKSKSRR